jgi:hypothetical protein
MVKYRIVVRREAYRPMAGVVGAWMIAVAGPNFSHDGDLVPPLLLQFDGGGQTDDSWQNRN